MGTSDSSRVVELLRITADALESLSDSELRGFIQQLEKKLNLRRSSGQRGAKLKRGDLDTTAIAAVINRLHHAETRDEAVTILKAMKLSRGDLVRIAQTRSIHVTKLDNISRIEEKIVEAIVGSRLNSEAIRGTAFAAVNARIVSQTEAKIIDRLLDRRFKFVFNPETGGWKFLSFKPDGAIGEGQNRNECTWRIKSGRLEIKNNLGEVYSRFILLPDGKFQHTNDPDTLSIKGQYFVPSN